MWLTSYSDGPEPLGDSAVLNVPCNKSCAYFWAQFDLHSTDLSIWLITLCNEILLPAITLISYHPIRPDPIALEQAALLSLVLPPRNPAAPSQQDVRCEDHPQLGCSAHSQTPSFRTDHKMETTEHSTSLPVALCDRPLAKFYNSSAWQALSQA